MSVIPECNWTDFVKIVKEGRVKELKSCKVKFNSELIFTTIIPHSDPVSDSYVNTQAEYLGMKSNMVGGKDPAELLNKEECVGTV